MIGALPRTSNATGKHSLGSVQRLRNRGKIGPVPRQRFEIPANAEMRPLRHRCTTTPDIRSLARIPATARNPAAKDIVDRIAAIGLRSA